MNIRRVFFLGMRQFTSVGSILLVWHFAKAGEKNSTEHFFHNLIWIWSEMIYTPITRVYFDNIWQPPARFSFLENFLENFLIFTSRSRSRAIWVSLSTLEKEWKEFIFHFSLLEKSESYLNFTLFSREKRVKSGAGYDLTSLYLPKLYFF